MPRLVTYSLALSLDGYVVDSRGSFDWAAPDEEVFALATDEVRGVDVHLMGRHLYETMLYWETADLDPDLSAAELEFTALWKALPRLVFSRSLSSVQGRARLAEHGLAEEIERLRAEPGEGTIAIGGATLAAEAASLGLIDEYRLRIVPALVGGGLRFFAHDDQHVGLELVESHALASQVVYLRYRVVR